MRLVLICMTSVINKHLVSVGICFHPRRKKNKLCICNLSFGFIFRREELILDVLHSVSATWCRQWLETKTCMSGSWRVGRQGWTKFAWLHGQMSDLPVRLSDSHIGSRTHKCLLIRNGNLYESDVGYKRLMYDPEKAREENNEGCLFLQISTIHGWIWL